MRGERAYLTPRPPPAPEGSLCSQRRARGEGRHVKSGVANQGWATQGFIPKKSPAKPGLLRLLMKKKKVFNKESLF